MLPVRASLLSASGIVTLAVAAPAMAQDNAAPPPVEVAFEAPSEAAQNAPMPPVEVSNLPAEYQNQGTPAETSTTTGIDGIETITRTRRIPSAPPSVAAPAQAVPPPAAVSPNAQYTYYQAGYAQSYAPIVLDREQWIAECERRTDGRSDEEKGGIIGGLLGAIGGGIAGHELAAAGEALGGTLIGAGVGGLLGLFIGNLIAGDGDEDDYDCEGALNTYLDQYGQHGGRYASRSIPAYSPPGATPYQAYGYGYAYPQPIYYAPQQTVAMVPVTTFQQQRVVVRETVREEVIPGAVRTIPSTEEPLPSPKLIKQSPSAPYAPTPSPKMIKD